MFKIHFLGEEPALLEQIRHLTGGKSGYPLVEQSSSELAKSDVVSGDAVLILIYLATEASLDGIEEFVSELVRTEQPTPMIVICEPEVSPQARLRLLRSGAVDCLERPLNLSRLSALLDIVTIRSRRLEKTVRAHSDRTAGDAPDVPADFLVASPVVRELMDRVRRVAPLSSTILLTGETGSGKTQIAQVVHRMSNRRRDPFLVVPCAAIPPTLVETELFGHARGAFTGADGPRIGKFKEVGEGTLLLDEVDCLPLEIQGKLLRAVEERAFEPVGSNRVERFRGRLIAASNRQLPNEISAGRFRSDLFYRLNVISLHLPPLRERRDEIIPLAIQFLRTFASQHGLDVREFSPCICAALEQHNWPGNIRELRNLVESLVVMSRGHCIELNEMSNFDWRNPDSIQVSGTASSETRPLEWNDNELSRARRSAERQRLSDALQRNDNNRTRVAKELRISRVTLYKKLNRHGLT